jgi:hypothetical protein
MRKRNAYLLSFFVSALSFWSLDFAIHWHYGLAFGREGARLATALLPISTSIVVTWVLVMMRSPARQGEERISLLIGSFFGVCGIWVTGPVCMTINSTLTGGGFATAEGWVVPTLGTVLWPIFGFMMAAYDGSLFALLIITVLLPLIAVSAQAWRWVKERVLCKSRRG